MSHLARHVAVVSATAVLVWTLAAGDTPKYETLHTAGARSVDAGSGKGPSAVALRDAARSVIGQLPVGRRNIDVDGVAESLRRSLAPDGDFAEADALPHSDGAAVVQ